MTPPTRHARIPLAGLAAAALLIAAGCESSPPPRPSMGLSLEQMSRTHEAKARQADETYARAAAALARGDAIEAEGLLQSAVTLNPYHGGAHNDLGLIFFRRGNLHEAALHFDAAAKTLVSRAEPYYNLGMVWESAGRYRDAVDAYQSALKFAPGDLATTENLARVYIRMNAQPHETVRLLEMALGRETRQPWRDWMTIQLNRLRTSTDSRLTRGSTSQPMEELSRGR